MKSILILGAGNAQIDAIKHCKQLGLKVFGCSYTNTDRGIKYLDEFIQIDIKDIEGIKGYVIKNKIDLVYSIGSDIAMPVAMKVSEDLNLPHFISSEAAYICQNKNEIRKLLGDNIKGNLPYIVAEKLEDVNNYEQFPSMMKPVDSQGQRGCYKINNKEELENYFNLSLDYSHSKKVIIEKYVDGPEVSVNAYLEDGEIIFNLISDRIVFDNLPGGIIKEHHVPSNVPPKAKTNINTMTKVIINKLGIKNGPIYFQIKLDGDSPYLIEVTPRLDGCHMWNLIKHNCGVDLLDITFRHLLFPNEKIEINSDFYSKSMKLKFICEKPGVIFNREKYKINNSQYKEWYYETGDKVKKLNGYMEKCGYIIVNEV